MTTSSNTSVLVICDAQIHAPDHAPDLPRVVHVGGLDEGPLLRAMDSAGVQRCVIVPLAAPSNESLYNQPALSIARAHPDRCAVMGRFDLTRPDMVRLLSTWREEPGMLGIRLSFVREPNLALLVDHQLDWLWSAAATASIPLMLLVPNARLAEVGRLASAHPELRLVVDHFGLDPYVVYDDLIAVLQPLLQLARYPNVAVKATALPDSVADAFPFRSLHEPIHRVVDAFGPRRVFWGSDLTRLKCPYQECVRLFTDELPFLSLPDKQLVMGQALMDWLRWRPGRAA